MTFHCMFKGHDFGVYEHFYDVDRKVIVCLKCGKRKVLLDVGDKEV